MYIFPHKCILGGGKPTDEEHDEPADPEPGSGGSPFHTRLCTGHCERLCPHVSRPIWHLPYIHYIYTKFDV